MTSVWRSKRLALKREAHPQEPVPSAASSACSAEPSCAQPLKLVLPRAVKKKMTCAERARLYRERMKKTDPEKYKELVEKSREYSRQYRASMTEEKRAISREQAKKRVQAKRDRDRGKPKPVHTRKKIKGEQRHWGKQKPVLSRKQEKEKQREMWRSQKHAQRLKKTPEELSLQNERRRQRYQEMKAAKRGAKKTVLEELGLEKERCQQRYLEIKAAKRSQETENELDLAEDIAILNESKSADQKRTQMEKKSPEKLRCERERRRQRNEEKKAAQRVLESIEAEILVIQGEFGLADQKSAQMEKTALEKFGCEREEHQQMKLEKWAEQQHFFEMETELAYAEDAMIQSEYESDFCWSEDARRKAFSWAKAHLPSSPREYAQTVIDLINLASPEQKRVLQAMLEDKIMACKIREELI
ncbi:uncharacterized protein LOC143282832 [Babylonia areolata]|uniref:uncharacterized protein LOC143282832 n=1 Tax=Babylonia areolata TaxID=304850 RepID=UPI003FD00222